LRTGSNHRELGRPCHRARNHTRMLLLVEKPDELTELGAVNAAVSQRSELVLPLPPHSPNTLNGRDVEEVILPMNEIAVKALNFEDCAGFCFLKVPYGSLPLSLDYLPVFAAPCQAEVLQFALDQLCRLIWLQAFRQLQIPHRLTLVVVSSV